MISKKKFKSCNFEIHTYTSKLCVQNTCAKIVKELISTFLLKQNRHNHTPQYFLYLSYLQENLYGEKKRKEKISTNRRSRRRVVWGMCMREWEDSEGGDWGVGKSVYIYSLSISRPSLNYTLQNQQQFYFSLKDKEENSSAGEWVFEVL